MKPYELYQQWSQFEAMMATSLSDEDKLKIGGEWVRSLPPKQLCVSSTLSYEIVSEAMKGRLNDLRASLEAAKEQHGSTQGKTEDSQGQKQEQGNNGRPKSVRKAKQDA